MVEANSLSEKTKCGNGYYLREAIDLVHGSSNHERVGRETSQSPHADNKVLCIVGARRRTFYFSQ